MDNENIATILKDAINASSTKIQSESKRTKVFVLPPELLKGLLVKNKLPTETDNSSVKAETTSLKNNKKPTTNKRQLEENSKSPSLPVDQPKRTNNRKKVANKDLKNAKTQKSSKKNPKSSNNTEQNHEQNTVLEKNETSDDTLKSVETDTIEKKSNRGRKTKEKKEIESLDFCNIEKSPIRILDKSQEKGKQIEINHEFNDCSINATSDKPLDNCSKEKCTTDVLDKFEENIKTDQRQQDDLICEISNNVVQEDNLKNSENIVSNCEKKSSDETINVGNIKSEVIDQVLQDPQIKISQSDASQKILNGEISTHVRLNDVKGENLLSFKPSNLSNDKKTIIEEETYILEEIIEIVESDEENNFKETKNDKVDNVEENIIQTDEVLVRNNDFPKPIIPTINIKSEPISKTSVDFKPIVEQKRSSTARVYINKRKSRKQTSNNDVQERSISQINNNLNDISISPTSIEISSESLCEVSQNLQNVEEKFNQNIDCNYDENNLTIIPRTETISVNQYSNIGDLQKIQQSDLKIGCNYDENIAAKEVSISNAIKKEKHIQEIQQTFKSELNCDSGQNNSIDSILIEASVGDSGEELKHVRENPEIFNSKTDNEYDENSFCNTAETETIVVNQCQNIKYSEVKKEPTSEIDYHFDRNNLSERANTSIVETSVNSVLKLSQQVQEKYSPEIECQKSFPDSAATENINQKVNYSQNFDDKINVEINCKVEQINSNTNKTEISKVTLNKELEQEEIVHALENNIKNDLEKSESKNKISDSVETLVENFQDPKESTKKISCAENISESSDAQTPLSNQKDHAQIKTIYTRSQRKSSSEKKDQESTCETIKPSGKRMKIDIESTKNTQSGKLVKISADRDINIDIKQTTAVSVDKTKTSISRNNKDLDKNTDYWENEQNCSIRSLRQLRNLTKVIPQDPEHLKKLKNNIKKESLHLRNRGKSDILVRYDYDCSNRTRSISLNLEPNNPEKLESTDAKKILRKPKSTDNNLENTSRLIALRRRSAILENEIKLSSVLETYSKFQSKENLSRETVKHNRMEIDSNQPKTVTDIVDDCNSSIKTQESTVIQKDNEMITSDSNSNETNLNEKLIYNNEDSQDSNLSTETGNSSLKREKVIVVRKIKKGRRSKSSQPKNNPAVTTDLKNNDNKSIEVNDSKMIDNITSRNITIKNNLVQLEIPKTANKTNPLEDNITTKSNSTTINSSDCQEDISVQETPLKIKSEKITPTRRGRRRTTAKSVSPKEIIAEKTKDESVINKNNESKIESTGDSQNYEKFIVNDSASSNSKKSDGISESNLADTSNLNSEVENALEATELKMKTEKISSYVRKGRKRRHPNIPSNVVAEYSVTDNQKINENIILSKDNMDNESESSSVGTSMAVHPVENISEEKCLKIKTEQISPVKSSRRGRRSKSMLLKNNSTTADKHDKNNTRLDASEDVLPKDSIPANHIVTSAEIHQHVENVGMSQDLDGKSKCDTADSSKVDLIMENSSPQSGSKSKNLPPAKKGKRGRRPKPSITDVNTKEVIENDNTISTAESNTDSQENNIIQIEEDNKNNSREKTTHSDMGIDAIIKDDTHESDLDSIGTVEKMQRNTRKRSTKLSRQSNRHDKQELLASNTSDTEIDSKDSVEKTNRNSRKSSKFNVKHDVIDSDDEPKNRDKDLSNMGVRKSGRRQKSNVNYCVPDEDVDVYESEKQTTKEPCENAPRRRRGRPSRKDVLKLNISVEGNSEQKLQETKQNDATLGIIVNDDDAPVADTSITSTRKRRSTKRSTIDEDIFEVKTEPTKQDESIDTPDQSQTDTLSDVADETNDFEGSHVSDKYEEETFEEPKPCRRRKRKYSFTTKKRGRPPMKKKVESNDDDYTPHHSYIPRPSKVKEKSKEIPDKKIVKCGKCEKEVPKNQWYSHNLYSHNDMGWLDGAVKPDYENDSKLLMRVLTAAHKKKHKKGLICESCREVKKSVAGFISHMTFCGKTDEEIASLLVTCDQCGGKFKPSSMEYHERQHRLEAEGKKKREKEMAEIDIFEPRSKRKAAEKAVSKISEFTALVKDEDGGPVIKKLKLSSPHIKKFIQKPLATKKISSILIAKWKRELENNQNAACTQLGCQFTCKSIDEMREHYSSCNFTVTENYVCKVCRFQTMFEDEIIKHAAEKHTSEDLDINAQMSEAEASDSEDYSDFDEDSSNKSQRLVKKFFYKETSDVENKMFKFIFNNGACHTILNKTFLPGFQWTLDFERKHFKFSIFNDFTPNVFTLMEEKDAENYLPELISSLPVKFINKDGNFNCSEWKNWSRFEATCVDDCPTFFVGGPVWAMAWAPIPSYLAISDDLPQFLAVSTHPKMDIEYSVGESYSGKNIIQIWNVGKLNNRNASESEPELSYAICHDGGTVWSLEWCPSGCYQHENFPDLKNENDTNRLGLLAAGCSDGCVRIYSLVFPQDIHAPKENPYPFYKTEPVIQLIISLDIYDNNEQNWQITKLSWSRESNHNIIVAGLSNGYVAFWDLTTKSPMLKYKVNNTTFFRPYRQFFAHHHAVTMVALISQDNKRYLATAGLDKMYKFWDLEDISRPKNTYKKSYVTDGAWFNNWCCAILVHDDALCSSGNNSAICLPLRDYTYKYYNILPSNSTIYGISTSDFGNSIATGNIAGELLTLFPHQLIYIRDMEKTLPPKRSCSLVSTTKLVDFNAEEINKTPMKKGKKGKTDLYNDPKQFMPSTYNDSKDRFGIVFNNKIDPLKSNSKSVQKYKKKPTLTCEQLEQTPIEQYPLKSINKVAWNPNASSFLWLAAGYQNGFVRLISFRSVASTAEWNKLLQLHRNALKAQMAKTASEDAC